MTPELIGILAVGATVIGLMLTFRRDARADLAEVRSGHGVAEDLTATHVSGPTERMSRLEGVIEGFFARTGPPRRRLTDPKSRQGRVAPHEVRRAGQTHQARTASTSPPATVHQPLATRPQKVYTIRVNPATRSPMPLASLADLLLLPLLRCLHFPVSGPYPQSPSLLTPLPSLFPISLLTSLPTHSFGPRHPRAEPAPEPVEGRGPSGIQPPGRFQLPRPPLHTERTALFLPYPRAHRPRPFRPIWTGPNTPQNRQKSAPRRLKSFLEKTLTARETPNSPPPKTARSQTPHHSGSASSSLALWERVGVRVFRSKRCPVAPQESAPAGASTPIRRRPTVPNPAHLAATTGDNRMADPLPRRTR